MKRNTKVLLGVLATLAVCAGSVAIASAEKNDMTARTSESSVVTNENGSVSRSFTECSVTTNGNFVTERRRETRTDMDTDGTVLETSTSEYTQTYTIGDGTFEVRTVTDSESGATVTSGAVDASCNTDAFMGLKFGEVFDGTNLVKDVSEPTLLRGVFTPKKALAGFDDYYVYVTPTTHRVVKVYACAKEAIEPGTNWRRHYLIEALEKRYQTWARLCSFRRPFYSFDLGNGRYITACLWGATQDYETVIAASDRTMMKEAADEQNEIIEAARKAAADRRRQRVESAAEAF